MKRIIILGLVAFMLVTSLAAAQVATQGRIVVVVEDPQSGRLPGATVTASAADTVTSREAVTNGVGEATLVALDPSAEYYVQVSMPGFASARNENVLVRSGHTATLRVGLVLAGVAETVTVTSETPLVDTTSAITGQDITLDLTESLPTQRTYQGYLQLVPGVMPDDPDTPGNPASKSGLNYRDIQGDVGVSRDNFYYIDGINVTDGLTGTFGANLNTEVIQEQKVLTGGVPAEYVGSPGLISNVVLKAGSNTFSGSANYFAQNSSLVADNKNLPDSTFSRFDAAFTIGGPIIEDKAWFFGSYRRLGRDDDVVANDTGEFLRSTSQTENQSYVRGTFSPTSNDTFSFTFLNDPLTRDGSRDITISNARDTSREQGGNRYNVKYSRLIGMNALLDVGYNKHNGEVSAFSVIREDQNAVAFPVSADFTRADQELGGEGEDNISERDNQQVRIALDYSMDVHDLKFGVEWRESANFRNVTRVGVNKSDYASLDPSLSGSTINDYVLGQGGGTISGGLEFDHTNASDYGGFIKTIDARPDRAAFYSAYDLNSDGTISQEELGSSMVFNSTAGNPHGQVNYDRTEQVEDGALNTSNRALSLYGQDSFRMGNFVINAGLRAEKYTHFDSNGDVSSFFDWSFAPRLSAVYDLKGDGRQKVSAFWGRYYDPIRGNMTNFAGSLSGRVNEEQVWANAVGAFVPYRTRGGPKQPDALFAPTTKTPFTDDFQLGYEIDLGNNLSFEAIYTNRRTRDILEDYDLALYAFDTTGTGTLYPGPLDHPDSLWLGLDYFGYDANPGSNFVIATLEGGKRDYQGVEFTFRKRFTDSWQALVSYNYNDAEGNTNSDSNADFQGDVLFLDPRAPNQLGDQPGLIRHLFKGGVTYRFDMGLEVGGTFQANSGFLLSRTFLASRRHLPIRVTEPFEYAGFDQRWIAPDTVGVLGNPGWAQVDLRVQYVARFAQNMRAEFFVDMFNITNNQSATREMDLVGGDGAISFGDEAKWVNPRRFFLGARFNF